MNVTQGSEAIPHMFNQYPETRQIMDLFKIIIDAF